MTFSEFVVYTMVYLRIPMYVLIFILGTVFGSFLNVCILRTPLGQSIAKEPSHCMTCGKRLHWYELIPLFSWLFLRGKCHGCKAKISGQYPFVEFVTGAFFAFNLWFSIDRLIPFGILKASSVTDRYLLLAKATETIGYMNVVDFVLIDALFCALLVLTFIDARTHEIPNGINIFIAVIGLIRAVLTGINAYRSTHSFNKELLDVILGPVCVAGVLLLILIVSGGGAIGGGDVKLMAAVGLFLGNKATILALVLGCMSGALIHLILMKVKHLGRELAMGPYLSLGIIVSVFFATPILTWYLGMFTFESELPAIIGLI